MRKAKALLDFFRRFKCPQPYYIDDYVHAADQNNLDYRILAAISVQESSCGRYYPEGSNNLYGWDSGRERFASVPAAIDYISEQLAGGRYYAGKSLVDKLHAYNPNPEYAPKIIGLMESIK